MDSTEDRFVVLFSILMSGSWYLPSGCSPLILNIFITDVWRPPEKKQFRCSPAGRSTACTRDIHHHWDHILIVERVFRMNLDLETYRWRTQQRMLTCGGKMAFPHLCYFNFFFFLGRIATPTDEVNFMSWHVKKGFELRDLPHYFAPAGTPEINCCRLLIVVCACLPGYYFYLTLKHVYRDNLHALIKLRPFVLFFWWHWISS